MNTPVGRAWADRLRGIAPSRTGAGAGEMVAGGALLAINRRPDVDGLRAVAALAVLLYHALLAAKIADIQALGFWGVSGFFALSGYLITGLLRDELGRTGRINVRRFWGKRVRRLVPALAVVVLLVTVWEAASGEADIWRALTALMPWSNLVMTAPDTLGVLSHVWTLAIEAQFYMVWPLVLPFVMRVARPWLWLALAAAVIGAWRATLPETEADYGTLARMDAFLFGSAMALTGLPRVTVPGVGWLAPVGVRSYGLYLWHVPILFLLSWTVPVWLLVAVSAAAAAMSWRYIERPTSGRGRRLARARDGTDHF